MTSFPLNTDPFVILGNTRVILSCCREFAEQSRCAFHTTFFARWFTIGYHPVPLFGNRLYDVEITPDVNASQINSRH